ncbi:glycosyltransferase [Microvirga sp. 2YAF29]|uniref:glycosyltransferase n=1 Tax=Microvirga sp. 2YAF29 TaxID=3233031 RepID=UPI003F9CCDC2
MREGLAESVRQSTALPAEIGFLAHYGYPPETLRDAAMLADLVGVSVDDIVLKTGMIEEVAFYRALADELRLPFLADPRLSSMARYPDSILSGIAPLAKHDGGFVIAPRGPTLSRLFKGIPHGRLAITAPSLLARAAFRGSARRIADRAAHALPNTMPHLSIRGGVSTFQITIAATIALALSFSAASAPNPTFTIAAAILSPLFFGIVVLRLAASLLPHPVSCGDPANRIDDASLPIYTIIVALYREGRIASRLIAALRRLDYPAAKLDIKLVLEADDRETIAALRRIRLPGFVEIIVAPPGEPRTKPRALNIALPLARGRYTVVYDAEDVPDAAQLRLAVSAFAGCARDIACLQARLTIDNTDDSWLTRLFTIEYAALFDVLNPGLAEIGSPIPLGGTSNHFRTSVLKRIYGWDAWNVTEDADLGFRLSRFGYRVADLPSSTLEEAPITLGAWLRQRTRWMKGYMQTTISHSRKPALALKQFGFWRFCSAMILSAGAVLSALVYPFGSGLFLISWLVPPDRNSETRWDAVWSSASLTLFTSGALAIFIPACVALHRRRLWRLLPWVPLLPFYYALVSVAAWRGVWELTIAPFRWNKTSHGHARTSRANLSQKHQANVAETISLNIAPP